MEQIIEIKNRCEFRLKGSSERLNEELDWINSYGGAKALLIASNMIRDLKKAGVFVGCGHGYACCSLVCYGLGISDVNPITWNMPFSTFTRHFMEEPVFTINTSKGGSDLIDEIKKYADYPELAEFDGPVAEVRLLDDKSVDHAIYVINEFPEFDMLKSFQGHRSTDIKQLSLDNSILKAIVEDGIKDFTLFSHSRMKERVIEFAPECFSDLCALEAMFRPFATPKWEKLLEAKKNHNIPSTGINEIDRILMETYGQLLYEEQLDAIKDLKQSLGTPAIEKALEILGNDESKLSSKGTIVASTLESVLIKAFEMKMPGEFNEAAAPLVDQRKAERIKAIKEARERIRKQHE